MKSASHWVLQPINQHSTIATTQCREDYAATIESWVLEYKMQTQRDECVYYYLPLDVSPDVPSPVLFSRESA